MYRKSSNFLDYGIETDIDPKIKYNSLLSATISTVMCLAAKYPLPKSNVETTKLFLGRITDDNGDTPRNVKAILHILNSYNGPYDTDGAPAKEKRQEDNRQADNNGKRCVPYEPSLKGSQSSIQIHAAVDGQVEESSHAIVKRTTKLTSAKRSEKDAKKLSKSTSSKIPMTKSTGCKA